MMMMTMMMVMMMISNLPGNSARQTESAHSHLLMTPGDRTLSPTTKENKHCHQKLNVIKHLCPSDESS